jgi:hypothetical protein
MELINSFLATAKFLSVTLITDIVIPKLLLTNLLAKNNLNALLILIVMIMQPKIIWQLNALLHIVTRALAHPNQSTICPNVFHQFARLALLTAHVKLLVAIFLQMVTFAIANQKIVMTTTTVPQTLATLPENVFTLLSTLTNVLLAVPLKIVLSGQFNRNSPTVNKLNVIQPSISALHKMSLIKLVFHNTSVINNAHQRTNATDLDVITMPINKLFVTLKPSLIATIKMIAQLILVTPLKDVLMCLLLLLSALNAPRTLTALHTLSLTI